MSDLEHGIRTVDVPILPEHMKDGAMDPDAMTLAFLTAITHQDISLDHYTVGESELVPTLTDGVPGVAMRVTLHPGQEPEPNPSRAPLVPRLRVVGE
jgi:hypothetical protein